MAPPPLPFQQALALLQSGQHRRTSESATATHQTSPHRLSPAQITTPSHTEISQPILPIFPYEEALAMLQRGEHRTSHRTTPSMHPDSASHNPSREGPRPMPSSTSTSTQSAYQNTLSIYRQLATMSSRDRPRQMLTETAVERASSPSSSGLHSAESVAPITPPSFQEALAMLHRGRHQSNVAEAEVHNARSRQQTAFSISSQDTRPTSRQEASIEERPRPVTTASRYAHDFLTSSSAPGHHDATHQEAAAPNVTSANQGEANRTYNAIVAANRQRSHQEAGRNLIETLRNFMGTHRQQSIETPQSTALTHLPSLSFEEACKTINWRSATELEIMNCGICLDDFESEDQVHLLPNCNHLFHVECVKEWLLRVGSCPCCRDMIIDIKDPAQQ